MSTAITAVSGAHLWKHDRNIKQKYLQIQDIILADGVESKRIQVWWLISTRGGRRLVPEEDEHYP